MNEKDRLAYFRKMAKRAFEKANEADIPDEPKLKPFGFLLTEQLVSLEDLIKEYSKKA